MLDVSRCDSERVSCLDARLSSNASVLDHAS
jgi:hypothetical protein